MRESLTSACFLAPAEKFDEWFTLGDSKEGEAEVVQQLHKVGRP